MMSGHCAVALVKLVVSGVMTRCDGGKRHPHARLERFWMEQLEAR